MGKRWRSKRGQSILSEYTMIFFVVIAAVVAMTAYVQRGFQARIHDARNFMISSVANSSVCDANCVQATGGAVPYQYEPYYAIMLSNVQHNEVDTSGATTGNPAAIGVKYIQSANEETKTISTSVQLPPEWANST